MILNTEQFIRERSPEWERFEELLDSLEANVENRMDMDAMRNFHVLYEHVAADLVRINAYAAEPETARYLESLVARGFSEMHVAARRLPLIRMLANLVTAFPRVVRFHSRIFALVLVFFGGGAIFGGLALAFDSGAKSVLMPFSHLQGSPNDRVAEEEAAGIDVMAGAKSTFAAELMTHNIKVSIFTLALGMTFGFGTGILLFYNGAILGAVAMDYLLAGEGVFLGGWLLPHGSVEIPAILLAGQGGLLIGRTLLFADGRKSVRQRFSEIRNDVVILISGIGFLLIWAGIIESFFSQYHAPVIPYSVKITFGVVQLFVVFAYFSLVGQGKKGIAT